MIKSREIIWARHVVRMGRRIMHIGFNGKARRKEIIKNTKS
jgi:hypothetical protein